MKQLVIIALIALLLAPAALAKQNRMTLLAVTETPDGYAGASADLVVEIMPGTGRVFIDTFPLSKLDTQISTRFAKEIACEFSAVDCAGYDFFYTIHSTSAIIAGPSAGAALAGLTLATLEDYTINDKVAVTGTINSGGLIGPVSGIREKIDAALDAHLETVLIPYGSALSTDDANETMNLSDYGARKGVIVREVTDIAGVVLEMTGKDIDHRPDNFTVDVRYSETMRTLARTLCERSDELAAQAATSGSNSTLVSNARNLSERGRIASGQDMHYAAASYCFGANVRYNTAILDGMNLTPLQVQGLISTLRAQIATERRNIPTYKTITDLETYALVLERITESEQSINDSEAALAENDTRLAITDIAFASERLKSAQAWASFFGSGGASLALSEEDLKTSCIAKLAEAEERFQYVRLFLPAALEGTRNDLDTAYSDLRIRRHDVCIFKASRAKAEADSVLSAIGVSEENLPALLEQKARVVRLAISKQVSHGTFPLAGYSYYEYAKSLESFDPASALLFYEYALELSDLDLYLKMDGRFSPELSRSPTVSFVDAQLITAAFIFLLGLSLGVLIGLSRNAHGGHGIKKRRKKMSETNPHVRPARGAHGEKR